jgi:hypothetical protein
LILIVHNNNVEGGICVSSKLNRGLKRQVHSLHDINYELISRRYELYYYLNNRIILSLVASFSHRYKLLTNLVNWTGGWRDRYIAFMIFFPISHHCIQGTIRYWKIEIIDFNSWKSGIHFRFVNVTLIGFSKFTQDARDGFILWLHLSGRTLYYRFWLCPSPKKRSLCSFVNNKFQFSKVLSCL